jgi:hypothetical protein
MRACILVLPIRLEGRYCVSALGHEGWIQIATLYERWDSIFLDMRRHVEPDCIIQYKHNIIVSIQPNCNVQMTVADELFIIHAIVLPLASAHPFVCVCVCVCWRAACVTLRYP